MHTVKLKEKRWIATSTAHFILEKPPGYKFIAGQFMDVRLPGKEDLTHHFTITNSPDEETLSFATRMRRSTYKDRLDKLDTGAELQISDASGDFEFKPVSGRKPVFIAGGIGITPFWSILQDSPASDSVTPIVLVYSNRRPQDVAFFEELRQLAEARDSFEMIATITEPDFAEMNWAGETGPIDAQLIRKAAPNVTAAEFYIAGPPAMVKAMQTLVADNGAPGSQIHAEKFVGYEERPGRDRE
jgi:ferredoxin-NADP reductase